MTSQTTSSVLRFSQRVLNLVAALALVGLMAADVSAQSRRSTVSYDANEFGASPDSYFDRGGLSSYPLDNGFNSRPTYNSQSPSRSRDPAYPTRPVSRDEGLEPSPFQSFPLDTSSTTPRQSTPSRTFDDLQNWDAEYAPRPRSFQVEDLPRPQRYADPRVVRLLQQMTQASGESLFAEISQYIDQRHIQPTNYQQRVRSGLEHLSVALQDSGFQQALGMRADARTVEGVQQQLASLAYQSQPQDLNQSVMVMRQAGQMVSQSLQVNPAVAGLAFVYGSLDTLDKFSMFVAPEKSGETSVGLQTSMVGIGVEIESHPQGLKILKALSGGPAAAATLQRGDIITKINGQPVAGMSLNQAADLITGPNGTTVQLELRRSNMIGDVDLVRRPFEVHSVAEVRMESGNVGYIKLDQFTQTSTQEMDAALWKLHNEGMKSLILDLRGNPGGLLTTAIEISNQFLPSGTIVSTRGRNENDNSLETASPQNTWKVPLVVLVDHNSASASEIFAAAIQENGRGLIVGEKSYGKGTVQTLFPLKSVPSALRLTTAKFYSPDGREMAGAGVTPDLHVNSVAGSDDSVDLTLQAALRAANDPRVIDMANRSSQANRSSMRVFKVVY